MSEVAATGLLSFDLAQSLRVSVIFSMSASAYAAMQLQTLHQLQMHMHPHQCIELLYGSHMMKHVQPEYNL